MAPGTEGPQLCVQINQIDYTLESPGEFDDVDLPLVPIIRIYGPSSLEETACVHVHQVYPYFYVEYLDKLDLTHVKLYTATLARSLNHALALSLKRNPDSPRSKYIRDIVLVKGVHFYGFHAQYAPFLKICLADPAVINRAAAIMQSGTVMTTRFRTYESHLGFILQFMCDFNLYGCGWIDLGRVFIRGAERFSEGEASRTRHDLAPSSHYCQSRLPLEVDVAAPHILNRHQSEVREMHHRLEIPAPLLSKEPLISSVRELWDDERTRRLAQGLDPSPEMPVDPSESSRGPGGNWVAETRLQQELFDRIQHEGNVDYEVLRPEWEEWTTTAFESIEVLWKQEYRTVTHLGQPFSRVEESLHTVTSNNDDIDIQVDVDMLSSQEFTHAIQLEEGETEDIFELHEEDFCEVDETSEYIEDPTNSDDPFLIDEPSVEVGYTMPRFESGILPVTMSPPTQKRVLMSDFGQSRLSSPESPSKHNYGESTRPLKRRRYDMQASCDIPVLSLISEPTTEGDKQTSQFARGSSYRATKVKRYEYYQFPPSTFDLLKTLELNDLPDKIYREPYYSNSSDTPKRARIFAGLVYRLKGGQSTADLEEWRDAHSHDEVREYLAGGDVQLNPSGFGGWEYASSPPSVKQSRAWLQMNRSMPSVCKLQSRSQITGASLKNIYGVGTSPGINFRGTRCMSILSLEVFVDNDGKVPDPEKDQIAALFYAFQKNDVDSAQKGAIVVSPEHLGRDRTRRVPCEEVASELDAMNLLSDVVVDLDPDVVTGWEVQRGSWGFVIQRAAHYGYEFSDLVSRAPARPTTDENDQWGFRHTSTIKIAGRHVLNGWRIMRSERSLVSYTLENVAFHILHRRIPHFDQSTLVNWYRSPVPAHSVAILRYFHNRSLTVIEILNQIEFVSKTAEFARVFGIDFSSVISRGSQFKVESFLFRIAKAENCILLSPSKSDVGKQNAAECMPLIMEPMSGFYSSPVVVLDFQSLYPSVMIAYNYCYSTCLGRVAGFKGRNKLGVADLELPRGMLHTLRKHIQIAPNGVMYAKPIVRAGLLRRMLTELLETRVMVKQAMKTAKNNKSLLKTLDARQLGLKYICNVTYGYTSATYSGRMPAVEIADSIVQTGRETLEKAIAAINSTSKWGAQVVYGDTDSVFVHLPGRTKEQAFRIGSDIAETITALNPSPIKLKFEKVYHPCVLLAKKRYVGFKYEHPDQTDPVFDAKGIETVRRDGVSAQQKMTESCLKMLFRSQDLSEIKAYCYRSWAKLLDGRASIRDFIFSKEVKLGTYSDKGLPPPGAVVAARRVLLDPNNEPHYGERVPYVITTGPPGSRLVDRAMDPLEFMQNGHLRLDATFYITRVLIPPLERILNLVGADVKQWYKDMPKPSAIGSTMSSKRTIVDSPSKLDIGDHFQMWQCLVCTTPVLDEELCEKCRSTPQETIVNLGYRIQHNTDRLAKSHLICASCTAAAPGEPIECDSLDCSWFFARKKAERRMQFTPDIEMMYRG
ncbi:hypothetical protein APHAL10511_006372 [Amanita phalloides]|nr:hypothetical protein APHAL10511_006372 [Amanita phalloides]